MYKIFTFLFIFFLSTLVYGESTDQTLMPVFGENYEDSMHDITVLIEQNKFDEAIGLTKILDKHYPKNKEVLERLASLHYWNHSFQKSIGYYEELYQLSHDAQYLQNIQDVHNAENEYLTNSRKNFVLLKGEHYDYGKNRPSENDITLQAGYHANSSTWIGSVASINRYGLNDKQLGLEAYHPLGEKADRRWGFLSFYQASNPFFLAQYDFSVGVYQGIWSDTEIGLVYRRMIFKDSAIDIYKPSISTSLPWMDSFYLNEEIYLVPATSSYAVVSTLSWDPTECVHVYYALTIGNGNEVTGADPLLPTKTLSHSFGGSWRFSPLWQLGASVIDEDKSSLYKKIGGELFLKYFW